MERAYRIRRVAFWTVAGVLAGMVVGIPLAHSAERRDPTVDRYVIGRVDPWGIPPNGPDRYVDANVAAHNAMSAAIAVGFVVGLFIGLVRGGFFMPRSASHVSSGPELPETFGNGD